MHYRLTTPNCEVPNWLADLLDTANRGIGDPDQYIGPGHFLGEVDEGRARRAWTYSVMPTLRELYYNNPGRAEALDFDILRESLAPANASEPVSN